jgi:hypothetical protein
MPRASSSRSSSRSSYRSMATFRPTLPPPPPPKASLPLPPPVVYTPPPPPTFGQTIKEGIAFGIGTSIARNVVDSVANKLGSSFQQGPGTPKPFTPEVQPQAPGSHEAIYQQCLAAKKSEHCSQLSDPERFAWIQCMKESKFDDKACNHLFDERSGEKFFTG